jgi:ankyrin repeat protein
MLTQEQLEAIFDQLSAKYSRYLDAEEGKEAFEAFKIDIKNINGSEIVNALIARGTESIVAFSEGRTPVLSQFGAIEQGQSSEIVKELLSDAPSIFPDALFSSNVVEQFLNFLNRNNQKNESQDFNIQEFKGKLNEFKGMLNDLLIKSSRAIFLIQAKETAKCLDLDDEATFKLIELVADPHNFDQFKDVITQLNEDFDKDIDLQRAINHELKVYNSDPKCQEKLRGLIQKTLQENASILYILQKLNIVSTQRFADMEETSLRSFRQEALLEEYRTSLEFTGFAFVDFTLEDIEALKTLKIKSFKEKIDLFYKIQGINAGNYKTTPFTSKEVLVLKSILDPANPLSAKFVELLGLSRSPFDEQGKISDFTKHFLDHLVPATTYSAAFNIKESLEGRALPSKVIPVAAGIERGKFKLTRLDSTDLRCYHLGDAVNCCLHAGGDAEQCIIDGITQPTSGFYVVTEKKGKGKEKICAAIYAFISRQGNLILDSIEPLNHNGKSEYAAVVRALVMDFANAVVQDTQRDSPIHRVCLGIGGNTDLCFDQDTLDYKALSDMHEQTQEHTFQYDDSTRVIVLAHSVAEEERLQRLITLVGAPEDSQPADEDTQEIRMIMRELLLTYCSRSFYNPSTRDESFSCRSKLKTAGLEYSFEATDSYKMRLKLDVFYKEAFALLLPSVCQDQNRDFRSLFFKKGVEINTTYSQSRTALCVACQNNQTETVKDLISAGADCNIADWDNRTPLHHAAKCGQKNTVAELIQAGADVNSVDCDQKTPIFGAVERGQTTTVKKLLDVGANFNTPDHYKKTPLHCAAFHGHTAIVRLLLDKGANINVPDVCKVTPLLAAVTNGHTYIVRLLLAASGINVNFPDDRGTTPLLHAVFNGQINIVKLLLASSGIDVDCQDNRGISALFYVSGRGQTDLARMLVGAGARVDCIDKNNVTPLLYAAANGHIDIVRILVGAGAPVDCIDKNNATPLLYAAAYGHIDIVQILVQADAPVDCIDKHNGTPLLYAVANGHIDIVQILVEAGANVHFVNYDGLTPIALAEKAGYAEIVRFLRESLMKPSNSIMKK